MFILKMFGSSQRAYKKGDSMRFALILALSTTLISCASLKLGGEAQPEAPAELSLNSDDANQMGFNMDASATPAQAEQQGAAAMAMNEQRSNSELDAAAPETGTDTFHASISQTPGLEAAPSPEVPTQLPEKTVASWDQHASTPAEPTEDSSANFVLPRREEASVSYDEPTPAPETPAVAKKSSKKSSKISKNSKKSKKALAKNSKKSKKSLAKKAKSPKNCNKIVKSSKKSTKKAIAMCKAEKKKIAQKSKKSRKLASSNSSSVR